MLPIQQKSKEIAENPEVIAALKALSKHGVGVVLIHAHDDNGNFTDLPDSFVAFEEDLKVSFRKRTPEDAEYVTVGWKWNEEKQEAEPLMMCKVHAYCEDR